MCILNQPHVSAQHNVAKTMQKSLICFLFGSHDDSSEPVPSTSSEQVNNRPPTRVNESARNLPVPAKGQELSMLQWKMLIAMESPKLEDTKSSAVVR